MLSWRQKASPLGDIVPEAKRVVGWRGRVTQASAKHKIAPQERNIITLERNVATLERNTAMLERNIAML
jgi:hypothetical protein